MTDSAEPAFPLVFSEFAPTHTGLTKREYFAAMAMQGLCSQLDRKAMNEIATGERRGSAEAAIAVHLADALLAELERAVSMERRDG